MTPNEISHYESLKKQDTANRKLIKKLQVDKQALEKINKAYDNAGLKANYTPEMRNALTSMKITLLVNAT